MDKYSAAAHKWTDAEIAKLERELQRLYSQSYAEIKKKSEAILSKINATPDMTAAQRYEEFRKYKRLQSLEAQVADVLRDTNAEAVRIINGRMADVYSTNYKAATKLFPKDVVFPPLGKSAVKSVLTGQVTPFKQLAVDTLLSRANIKRELTRSLLTGIMQGESIPNLAKRMKDITNKTLSESIRIARTETTRVENSAKQDVGEHGKKLGFKMKKQWIATSDGRTRPEHATADGQIVDIDKPFIVGGEELMYPGDESGSAWNTINCRCTTINIIEKGDEDIEQHKIKGQYEDKDAMNEYEYFSKKEEEYRLNSIKELSKFNDDEVNEVLEAFSGKASDYRGVGNNVPDGWFSGADTKIRNATSGKYYDKAKTIHKYIEAAPKFEGTIYRGLALDENTISKMSKGSILKENGNLSSWTSKKDVANMFAVGRSEELNKIPVILKSYNPKYGTPVSHLSIFGKEESEVIVSNMISDEYIIKNITKENDIMIIELLLKE